jgi:lysophospholipase L1-like esterase
MVSVLGVLPLNGCSNSKEKEVEEIITDDILETQTETQTETKTETEVEVVNDTQEQTETETQTESETTETETVSESESESELSEIEKLSPGELAARKTQQANFEQARQTLYGLENSKDKTIKINQMDRQILANNSYDFSKKNIVFIGDSITEGIGGAITSDQRHVSYPDYVQSYLHFNKYLNHGKGGRMFSDYGDTDLSLALNFGNVTNINSDIIVVFAGVNDYICTPDNKRYGDINDTQSTAGYCGAVRYFMNQLKMYYGDRDIFFVMMYNVDVDAKPVYSDITTQPTLNDYLDVQRKLCKEYGFNVIDLYSIGFMDCTDEESEDYFLDDAVHPKDNGNIVLGEHIAAELSLYYSQK